MIVLVFILIFYPFSQFYWPDYRSRFRLFRVNSIEKLLKTDNELLSNSKIDRLEFIKYVNEYTPNDSIFYVIRQPEFAFYGNRKLIKQTDSRLVDFYNAENIEIAYSEIKKLEVNYLYLLGINPPTVFNSFLSELVGDPKYTKISADFGKARIYNLEAQKEDGKFIEEEKIDFSFIHEMQNGLIQKRLNNWVFGNNIKVTKLKDKNFWLQLSYKNNGLLFCTSYINLDNGDQNVYVLKLILGGTSSLFIKVSYYDKNEKRISDSFLWNGLLDNQAKNVISQFKALAPKCKICLRSTDKDGSLFINNMRIYKYIAEINK